MTEGCEKPPVRVDREAGIIYDVLVLGRKARNGRRYTDEAMEEALSRKLYDELQVYIGPHKRKGNSKRSPNNHAGELRGLYKAADGIRAREFHVNRATRGGQLALEIADKFPKRFGLSHHADVAGYEDENGEKIVTRILEVHVADIVKDAATTDGVFEEVEQVGEEGEDGALAPADAPGDEDGSTGWKKAIKDLIAAIHDDDSIDDGDKMTATKAVMKVKKVLSGDSEDDDDDEEETPTGEEEVDVKKLIKQQVKLAIAKAVPKSKPTLRPKSTARSSVTEDVTPKAKPAEKPKFPQKREDILAAYEDDEE